MNDISIKVSFTSHLSHLPLLRKAIRGICSTVVENEQCLQDIDLCINEAVSNVICHAYQNEPGHEIQVIVTIYSQDIVFQIIDIGLKNAEPINPTLQEVDIHYIENLQESGRGLFIIHQLMDEVTYKSEEGKNILILRKHFTQHCKKQ